MNETCFPHSHPALGGGKSSAGREPGIERRKHPRFTVKLPVEYRRAGSSPVRPGHTVNFSEDGFMLSVSERMMAGEELELKVYFSSASGLVTILAAVKVVWADVQAKEDGFFRFGARYLHISAADEETLKAFLAMYADPCQAPAGLESLPGGIALPSKLTPPDRRGRP